MPVGKRGFFGRGRLSAGTADADHAANAGEPRQGVDNDPGSEIAEDRSGAGSRGAAGEIVEEEILRLDLNAGWHASASPTR